jgi:hypothetical protein
VYSKTIIIQPTPKQNKTKQNKNCNALNTHSNKIMDIKIHKENGNDIGTNQAPLSVKEEGRLMRTKPKISS